jgi:hypothetical protein
MSRMRYNTWGITLKGLHTMMIWQLHDYFLICCAVPVILIGIALVIVWQK